MSIPYKSISYAFLTIVFIIISGTQNLKAATADTLLDKKLKALGIIKISGITPPANDILLDMEGNKVRLSDFKGKIVFLNFWATWCPPCVYEMPDMEKLHQTLGNKDFIVVAINLRESSKKVAKFLQKHNLSFKVLLDQKSKLGRTFGIRTIPTTFVLDKNGNLIGKASGVRDWDGKESTDLFKYLIKNY